MGASASIFRAQELEEGENKNTYVEPLLPFMGEYVDIKALVTRHEESEAICERLMNDIKISCDTSVARAIVIPVDDKAERINVTREITESMAQNRTSKLVAAQRQKNMVDIQKAMIYRQSVLMAMNNNYSGVRIAKIQPIDMNEARSVVIDNVGD